jgi:tRNA pseudouridine55 synthase
VAAIEKWTTPFKVGHAGTLDPMASGVLLMLVGPAVRLMDDYHLLDKEYVGTFTLGLTSPSADAETEIRAVENVPWIHREEFVNASAGFVGTISQTPPIFSAVRIRGRRAHNLARSGKNVQMPSRDVRVDSIEILHFDYPHVTLRIVCGTGTYVRSIGRDIARSLGSDAVMISLVRTRIGPFRLQDAQSMDSMESTQSIRSSIRPPQEGLFAMPHLILEDELLRRFQYGQHIELEPRVHAGLGQNRRFAASDTAGNFHAIIEFDQPNDVWKAEKYLLQPAYLRQLASAGCA